MSSHLSPHVFAWRPSRFAGSRELQLAERLCRRSLPSAATWHVAEHNDALWAEWQRCLPHLDGLVLWLAQPCAVFAEHSWQALLEVLARVDCVLPADPRSARPGTAIDYMSLRGFEQFGRRNRVGDGAAAPYDGREPFALLADARTWQAHAHLADWRELPAQACSAIALDAWAHDFSGYYDGSRADMLGYLPAAKSSLLDVGCGSGQFGVQARQRGFRRICGIELNPDEAAVARTRLDEVWTGDALTMPALERFDAVACLDMLEHLPEPDRLLAALHEWLRADGTLILSIPNVGHWSVVDDLLAGRWDEVPAGILCTTHLHFFTQRSLAGLLADSGWRVQRLDAVAGPPMPERFRRLAGPDWQTDIESLNTTGFRVVAVSA